MLGIFIALAAIQLLPKLGKLPRYCPRPSKRIKNLAAAS
jgi:hypothetical protein